MQNASGIDFAHRANQKLLAWLECEGAARATLAPSGVNWLQLGTHPDLVEFLWKLGGPEMPCACAIEGVPGAFLAHPDGGIVFGVARGTHTVALRLPEPEFSEAMATRGYGSTVEYPKVTFYAADLGFEWVLLKPYDPRTAAWFTRAREHAAELA